MRSSSKIKVPRWSQGSKVIMFKGNFCILQIVSVLLQHFSSRTRWGYSIFLSCVSAPLGQIDLFSCGNSRIQWSSLWGSQTWHALWEMKFVVNAAWAFIPRPQFHFLAPWLWREWRNALFFPSEKFSSVHLGRYFSATVQPRAPQIASPNTNKQALTLTRACTHISGSVNNACFSLLLWQVTTAITGILFTGWQCRS